MEYKKDLYSVNYKDNSNEIVFEGKIECSDYKWLISFMEDFIKQNEQKDIYINLINLKLLNSTGIRVLAVFIINCPLKVIIKINNNVTWQRVGIIPLKGIKPKGQILIEDEL